MPTPNPAPYSFSRLPLDALAIPELRDVLTLWAASRGDFVPSRHAIGPVELRSVLPFVMIVEVREQPRDFRFRLVGTALYRLYGEEITGESVRILTPPLYAERVWQECEEAVRTAQPHAMHVVCSLAREIAVTITELRLPLTTDGRRVDQILTIQHYDAPKSSIDNLFRSARLDKDGA